MNEYIIRKATLDDIPFLSEAIIAAEKGASNNLSFSTLFNLPESKVRELLISILEEEVDGCEFSVNNYSIAEFEGKPVGSSCGWIEGFKEEPSHVLKSNLISYTFPKESLQSLISKSGLIKGIVIAREEMAMQLEYGYIVPEHRGRKIIESLIDDLTRSCLSIYPELKKVQVQYFKNNIRVIKLFNLLGYEVAKEVVVDDDEILKYIPCNTKVLMEKMLN